MPDYIDIHTLEGEFKVLIDADYADHVNPKGQLGKGKGNMEDSCIDMMKQIEL